MWCPVEQVTEEAIADDLLEVKTLSTHFCLPKESLKQNSKLKNVLSLKICISKIYFCCIIP